MGSDLTGVSTGGQAASGTRHPASGTRRRFKGRPLTTSLWSAAVLAVAAVLIYDLVVLLALAYAGLTRM